MKRKLQISIPDTTNAIVYYIFYDFGGLKWPTSVETYCHKIKE
jgi:hypothetical protein